MGYSPRGCKEPDTTERLHFTCGDGVNIPSTTLLPCQLIRRAPEARAFSTSRSIHTSSRRSQEETLPAKKRQVPPTETEAGEERAATRNSTAVGQPNVIISGQSRKRQTLHDITDAEVAQLCLTLCNPMDCIVHGVAKSQAQLGNFRISDIM